MDVEEIISQLRAGRREVRGDGFGYAGSLISAYKKAVTALEELQEKLKETPPPAEAESLKADNPNCFGFGSDNTPECNCRKVYAPVVQR